jgi:hypothetical protein
MWQSLPQVQIHIASDPVRSVGHMSKVMWVQSFSLWHCLLKHAWLRYSTHLTYVTYSGSQNQNDKKKIGKVWCSPL